MVGAVNSQFGNWWLITLKDHHAARFYINIGASTDGICVHAYWVYSMEKGQKDFFKDHSWESSFSKIFFGLFNI